MCPEWFAEYSRRNPVASEPPDEGRVVELPSPGCACRTAGRGDWMGCAVLFALLALRRYAVGAP